MEIVKAFKAVSGEDTPLDFLDRRPGDVDSCFADSAYAKDILGWVAVHGLEKICEDSWR